MAPELEAPPEYCIAVLSRSCLNSDKDSTNDGSSQITYYYLLIGAQKRSSIPSSQAFLFRLTTAVIHIERKPTGAPQSKM